MFVDSKSEEGSTHGESDDGSWRTADEQRELLERGVEVHLPCEGVARACHRRRQTA